MAGCNAQSGKWNTDSHPLYDINTLQFVSETVATVDGVTNVLGRSYDSKGRNSGVSLSAASAALRETTYSYSDIGRLSAVAWSNDVIDGVCTATYAYVESSDLVGGYDVNVGSDTFKARKSFEANRSLISTVSNLWNSTEISTFAYGNDDIGRRTNRIDSGAAVATNTFGYNTRSELTSALMATNTYGYVYDPIGNRISATSAAPREISYLSNELNHYTNVADGVTNTPTYDADGNMLTYGDWTFEWNGENRLINASNSTTQISYSYDYMGRRFQKVVNDGSTVVTNTFMYDGWNLIAESDGSSTNHYVWGPDLSGSMQGAGGIGGLLASVQDGEAYFSCFDANGNLTDYVDDTGSNVAHYVYGPFGGTIAATGDKVGDFRFRFSTKYLDDELGWYYYGFRYYGPGLGRWLSRDPLEEDGGVNLYGFVGNNAVDGGDILGLASIEFEIVTGNINWLWPTMGKWAQPILGGTGTEYQSANYAKTWVEIWGMAPGGSCNSVWYAPDGKKGDSGTIRVWLKADDASEKGKTFSVPVRISIMLEAAGKTGKSSATAHFLICGKWTQKLWLKALPATSPKTDAANEILAVTIPSSGKVKIAEYRPTIANQAPKTNDGQATGRVTVGKITEQCNKPCP